MSSVTVLALNGRRFTIKVTPNSTILQVLEEVCQKQNLKPENYDLKHHSKILDTTNVFRFSGLPNNAQLELVPATKIREDSVVTICIQFEDGSRITKDFLPSQNLWNVLQEICPEKATDNKYPVLIYMRNELYGSQTFKKTTLKSLGLTGGRAMFRLIHKKPEELHTQANVSSPLPSKLPEEKPYKRSLIKSEEPDVKDLSAGKGVGKSCTSKEAKEPKRDSKDFKKDTGKVTSIAQKPDLIKKFIDDEREKKNKGAKPYQQVAPKAIEFQNEHGPEKSHPKKELSFQFLGERNALVFDLASTKAMPQEDLPDEFFELTVEDVNRLLHDLKEQVNEMEHRPLQTAAIRDLEESKRVLRTLNRYKTCVIRVQFPNRTVLQGTFSPLETFGTVMEFVRGYLDNPKRNFHLYTTPPKKILSPETRLVDANCVPSAIVHFGTDTHDSNRHYLRKDLMSKFISPSIAAEAAVKSRFSEAQKTPVNPGPSTSKRN